MLNTESFKIVGQKHGHPHFVKPVYDTYGFAQLPQTVRYMLTQDTRKGVPLGERDDLYQKYDTVILFFIDAFGWRFVERYLDRHPFLDRILRDGLVSKLSSQFPSTTAAHVTCIHTGLPVGESGVYEWNYYEPLLDALIAPLPFSFAGDEDRETLAPTGIHPTALYPSHTVYQDLRNHGVDSYVLQDSRFCNSAFTSVVSNGAMLVPYKTLSEAIASLVELREQQKQKSYYFFYYDKIDSISHHHGPNSLHVAAEIETFLNVMEDFFHPEMQKQRGKTLFIMTADHGHVEIDPATTFYLNTELPELLPLIRRNRNGQLLAPAGSPRDLFLHINDPDLDEAQHLLRRTLEGRADICRTDALIADGYFGTTQPSAELLSRIGDLVILPYANESVWWYEKGRYEQYYFGHHGGLTPQEMETVLLAMPYGM